MEVVGGIALEPDVREVVHENGDFGVRGELLELLGAPPRAENDDLSVLDVGEVHEREVRLLVVVGGEVAEPGGPEDGDHGGGLKG